eukprot:208831-Rhodomonas_salina.6
MRHAWSRQNLHQDRTPHSKDAARESLRLPSDIPASNCPLLEATVSVSSPVTGTTYVRTGFVIANAWGCYLGLCDVDGGWPLPADCRQTETSALLSPYRHVSQVLASASRCTCSEG